MDQIRIGCFLKELRKERKLTQEKAAEQLNVSSRAVSRWETGRNMPDIGMLVELADFYDVSIPEIINGERKSENMDRETKDTALAMAEYSRNEVRKGKQTVLGITMLALGIFIIISALMAIPNDSSWGSIYSILGSAFGGIGVYFIIRPLVAKRSIRMMAVIGCILFLGGVFAISDYVAVEHFHQVPRFRCATIYDSRNPDQLVHRTLFFTVIQENPGTEKEEIYILK